MFDLFGEFDSADEINETAVNLRKEGDTKNIIELARENGIDTDMAEAFIEGDMLFLCDDAAAAAGKIDIEAEDLKPAEIMEDWISYIKACAYDNPEFAQGVRKKGKTLKGAIGELLKWGFKNQYTVPDEIKRAAGVTASRVTLGIPGSARVKKIITDYYVGKKAQEG